MLKPVIIAHTVGQGIALEFKMPSSAKACVWQMMSVLKCLIFTFKGALTHGRYHPPVGLFLRTKIYHPLVIFQPPEIDAESLKRRYVSFLKNGYPQ